jgi:hypothetical protein
MPKRLLHLFGALAAVWASSPRSHPRRPARHIQPPRRAGTRAAAATTTATPGRNGGTPLLALHLKIDIFRLSPPRGCPASPAR